MKLKYKKIIVAALSVLCVSTAATGFAACKNKTPDVNDQLHAVYQLYVDSCTSTPLSYDDWLKLVITPGGDKGDKGDAGEKGDKGDKGDAGEKGDKGDKGDAGEKGDKGDNGEPGEKGETGSDGKDGTPGLDGLNGSDGLDGADGVGIADIVRNNQGGYTFILTNGREIEFDADGNKTEKKTRYVVRVVDQNGRPVPNANLRIVACKNYTDRTLMQFYSNSKGIAEVYFEPLTGTTYSIRVGDSGLPEGYQTKNDPNDIFSGIVDIVDKVYEYTYEIDCLKNSCMFAKHTFIPYTKVYSMTQTENTEDGVGFVYNNESNLTEEKYGSVKPGYYDFYCDSVVTATNWRTEGNVTQADLSVNLARESYKYFYFSPQVNATTWGTGTETDNRILNSKEAAMGTYKFTITCASSANVRLYLYDKPNTMSATDKNGIPLDYMVNAITGTAPDGISAENAAKYTGENSITVNFNSDLVSGALYFYLTSDANTTVKLTVERVGDAVNYERKMIEVKATATEACTDAKKTGETKQLMPIDGSIEAVLGDDGFYHVGSATGPYLYISLKSKVARFSSDPLYQLATLAQNGRGVFELGTHQDPENELIIVTYDYNSFVDDYAVLCSKDGLYRVNEELCEFLKLFGGGMATAVAAQGYEWLAVCVYYEPATGLPADGEGTESSPYKLLPGKNSLDVEGSAKAVFTAPEEGYYIIDTALSFELPSSCTSSVIGEKTYVLLTKGESLTLTLSGEQGSYTVNITQPTVIEAIEDFGDGTDGVNESKGTDADHPYTVTSKGTYQIVFNTYQCKEGLYLSFKASLLSSETKTFTFTVSGNADAYIMYNQTKYTAGQTVEIALTGKTPCMVLISCEGIENLTELDYCLVTIADKT